MPALTQTPLPKHTNTHTYIYIYIYAYIHTPKLNDNQLSFKIILEKGEIFGKAWRRIRKEEREKLTIGT